ncbi:probable inactive serine/threonine-protein kinase DDB_G0274821 [Arachis ipaensis]|uniref:probable inactive serine/threonine-protein kinase DDB_G0274821 n=1 Tax=Arachis ipaensis TaxID=130454 RepID=UPI000A2B636B|nr:probable inactive serine/threonine-protein kinase DDB_G0274821 [Arachis ipaensis]
MSHEVYNFGEGLLGKVAADNSHKWVYGDTQNGCESDYVGTWNSSSDHQPRAWEFQFNSGIQTVAVIGVREGLVQLGSFNKIAEDLNIVMSIQRKFSYLQSIPGVFAIQRPSYLPIQQQNPYLAKSNFQIMDSNNDMPLSNYNMVINQIGSINNNNSSSRILEEKSNYFSMVAINMMGSNNNNSNNTLQIFSDKVFRYY